MKRRDFLGSILVAAVAPSIVRADSLMRIAPRRVGTITATALDKPLIVHAEDFWDVTLHAMATGQCAWIVRYGEDGAPRLYRVDETGGRWA